MKPLIRRFIWVVAAAVLVAALPVAPGFAYHVTADTRKAPATDKNSNIPVVPRSIPDMIGYGAFDPPRSQLFDIKNLTVSGDLRVRPEMRNNFRFGLAGDNLFAGAAAGKSNANFVQQWVRLGINYAVSPDVDFFFQPQWAKNWGTNAPLTVVDPNGTGGTLFARQAYMLIRNLGVENLSLKAGRQFVVWGNHRIFGHFDWNNVGFTFDGLTARYNHPIVPVETGWLRIAEANCATPTVGACTAFGTATGDGDILFARLPMKLAGIAVEPAWIWESGGAGGTLIGGQQGNQTRHTVGARVSAKPGMFDATGEAYWQFGSIGVAGGPKNLSINAIALHADAGVTLFGVPMQPRFGLEFNYASGDGDNSAAGCSNTASAGCGGNQNTFSQLFPTNHIQFGYMDLTSWQNTVQYMANLQVRPTPNSHFEIAGHLMRLANRKDHWYNAGQGVYFTSSQANQKASLGQEIDVAYTVFIKNNKVAWQFGYGHFFPGEFLEDNAGRDLPGQDWGYTQLWINF